MKIAAVAYFPDPSAIMNVDFSEYDVIIAIDSGFDTLATLQISPHICIGDFDSVHLPINTETQAIYKLKRSKSYSDTRFVINYVKDKYANGSLDLFVQMDGRVDQIYSIFTHLNYIATSNLNVRVLSGTDQFFTLKPGKYKIDMSSGAYFSLFSLKNSVTNLTIANACYNISNEILNSEDEFCLSNKQLNKNIPVELSFSTGIIIVMINKGDKNE